MKKYVILGGNGVFGVHCALWLLENASPEKVICVGRNPEKPEPFTLNLGKDDPRYRYHQIHVSFEMDRLMEMFDDERPDVIINFAAQGEGAVSWKHSWRYFDTNATALARMTEELMARRYLERWIQIGTSELYGSVNGPVTEDAPIRPSSPYAASKAAGDMHLMSISQVLGFPMNIVRPSNAYAPGQLLHRVIPKAVVYGLTGQKMPLYGGGMARKSYIHARDLARAIWLVSEKAPFGRVYNVGPKDPISIRDIVDETASALGLKIDDLVDISPPRLGEDSVYWLDSTRIKQELGWEQEIGLKEGIADMVDWGRKYINQLAIWPSDYVLRA
jgi:dTDP-glucose 4,6-dehydratase